MQELKKEIKKRKYKIKSKDNLKSLILDLYHGNNQDGMIHSLDIGIDIINNNGDLSSTIRCKSKLTKRFHTEESSTKIINIWLELVNKKSNEDSSQNENSKKKEKTITNTTKDKTFNNDFDLDFDSIFGESNKKSSSQNKNIKEKEKVLIKDSKPKFKTSPPRYSGKRLKEWFIYLDGEEQGPFEVAEINKLIKNNKIEYNTPIWKEGMKDWVNIEDVNKFSNYFEITFGNRKVNNEIRKQLKVNEDYKIKRKDLLKITKLDLNAKKIIDMSFLKILNNLTWLNLSHNNIIDISFLKDLKKLKHLDLGNNKIINISSLKALKNLISLNLSYNKISNISSLKDLKNLKKLRLENNQTRNISFLNNLNNLTYLNLRNNKITDYSPIKGLNNLTNLYFDEEEKSSDDLNNYEHELNMVIEELNLEKENKNIILNPRVERVDDYVAPIFDVPDRTLLKKENEYISPIDYYLKNKENKYTPSYEESIYSLSDIKCSYPYPDKILTKYDYDFKELIHKYPIVISINFGRINKKLKEIFNYIEKEKRGEIVFYQEDAINIYFYTILTIFQNANKRGEIKISNLSKDNDLILDKIEEMLVK